MNRLVIILLLSVFSVGVYAQYAESSYSAFSHRQYGAQDSYSQSQYGGIYQTSSRSAHYGAEQSGGYRCSYHSSVEYQDRISANTFASSPSMEINTIVPISEEHSSIGGMRMFSTIRPPQRDVDTGDTGEKEPDTEDPNPTPLGDTPWLMMLLLALGYALRVRKTINE